MPVPVEEILRIWPFDPSSAEIITVIKAIRPLTIVDYNPSWPSRFASLKEGIDSALGRTAVKVSHVGSTSVPGLAAKDAVDIDLTVADPNDEDSYVRQLESAGWIFKVRQRAWYQRRYFERNEPYAANLHVWGPDSPEAERHRIFQEWMLKNPADRELYVQAKKEAAGSTGEYAGNVNDYNVRKEKVIHEILDRAFRSLGYLKEEGVDSSEGA